MLTFSCRRSYALTFRTDVWNTSVLTPSRFEMASHQTCCAIHESAAFYRTPSVSYYRPKHVLKLCCAIRPHTLNHKHRLSSACQHCPYRKCCLFSLRCYSVLLHYCLDILMGVGAVVILCSTRRNSRYAGFIGAMPTLLR